MSYLKHLAFAAAACALPSTAHAVITVTQYPGTMLGAFAFSVADTTITIDETWTNANNVFLQFEGLDAGVSYTVVKRIINNTGLDWTSLANELLDPGVDASDPDPQPGFVPAGFSTSNDSDGLSFDQGGSLPRTSTGFPNVAADEFTDARDFLDFFGGPGVASGSPLFTTTFGLTTPADTQPFLLSQRVNVRSVTPGVPEPATWAMMLAGFGLMGIAIRRRSNVRVSFA
jgi:PEP-CTERM motif